MDRNSRRSLRSSVIPLDVIFQNKKKQKQSELKNDWLYKRYHDESYNNQIEQYVSIWERIDNNIPIILSQSTFLMWWNILVIIAISYSIFLVPIIIFFTDAIKDTQQFKTLGGLTINLIFITVLFIHIFYIRPNTSIYKNGYQIKSRQIIIKRYRLQFAFSLVAFCTYVANISINNYSFKYFQLLQYFFIWSLRVADQHIIVKLQLLRIRFAIYRIIRLLAVVLFFVQWISCVYFYIDYTFYVARDQTYYPTHLWLTNSQCAMQKNTTFINIIQAYPWYVWFNYACYWTLQSISNVGYGDMTPRNPPQVAFSCVIIVVMSLMYGFFLNDVWGIIGQVQQLSNTRKKNRQNLKNYKKQFQVPKQIGNKLGSYMFEVWQNGNNQLIQQHIQSTLSEDLKKELFFNYRQKFFTHIPLFQQLMAFSQDYKQFFQKLVLNIKEKRFAQNQIIFNNQVFGQVYLYYPNSTLLLLKWPKSSFGAFQFFTKQPRLYSAKAKQFCKISSLSINQYTQCLKPYLPLYEKYCQLQEEVKFGNNQLITGQVCWSCLSREHQTHYCDTFFDWYYIMKKNVFQQYFNITPKINKKESLRYKFSRRRIKPKKVISQQIINQIKIDRTKRYGYYRPHHNL